MSTGEVIVEDWQGNFKRGYRYTPEGIENVTLVPADESNGAARMPEASCIRTYYYECSWVYYYDAEGNYHGWGSCELVRSTLVCTDGRGGIISDDNNAGGNNSHVPGDIPPGGDQPSNDDSDFSDNPTIELCSDGSVKPKDGERPLDCGDNMLLDEDGMCIVENLNMDDQNYKELTSCEKSLVKQYPHHVLTLQDNMVLAHQKTQELFGSYSGGRGRNDCADAFRYAYFNAINTMDLSSSNAKKWGDAHECDTAPSELIEKEMDLFNNAVGRRIATEAPNMTEESIVNLVLIELEVGNLRILSNLTSNNSLTLNSQLINSNNCN